LSLPGTQVAEIEASIEAVTGAPAIKAATLIVSVDYETATPLA
jgi:hypothetical protein